MFKIYFDIPEEGEREDIESQIPEKKEEGVDLSKSITDEQFEALSEKEQEEFFEKSIDRNFAEKEPEVKEEEKDEPETEEVISEDNEVDEVVEEEDSSESDSPDNTEKRLKDTQRAFRTARSENAELQKRLADLEKKISESSKPVQEDKPAELTLATIKPEVLQKALREDPVNTMRWIAEQQTKQTLEANRLANEQAAKETERQTFVKTSEESALKRFPVLKEILDMGSEGLEKLKATSKVKYEFGQKTAKYFKEFQARGDNEAFYNAAARAYVELSPQMIKEVQIETKRLAEQELANKKQVLGKVSVSGNRGTIGTSGTPKFKALSEDEFFKLTPSQQMAYWEESVDRKQAKRSR